MAKMGDLVVGIRGDASQLTPDLAKAERDLKSWGAKANRSLAGIEKSALRTQKVFSGLLKGLGVGLGAASIAGLTAFAKKSLEAADAIGKTADRVGVSVEALQELRHAADLTGVATGTLDMALQRFSRRLGEAAQGSGELTKTLKQYGISLRDSNGSMRSSVDILGDLADAIKNAESDQERLRIAVKAFDSEGGALVNTLKNGREGLDAMRAEAKRLGLVMNGDMVGGAARANDEFTRLSKTISIQFTNAIVQNADEIAGLTREALGLVEALLKLDKTMKRFKPSTPGESFAQGFLSGNPLGLVLGALPEAQKPQVVSKKIYGAQPDPGVKAIIDQAKQSKKAVASIKANYEDLADFWRLQAQDRYDVMSRGYDVEIDKHQQFVEMAKNLDAEYTDFWAIQAQDRYEVQSRAVQAMVESASNQFSQLEFLIGGWAKSSSDAIAEFATNGKFSFRDMIQSMIKDLISLMAYQTITKPLFGAIGGLFGGGGTSSLYGASSLSAFAYHQGGIVGGTAPMRSLPAALFAYAPRLHSGLRPDEFPAVLQKGEAVIPKDKVGSGGDTYITNNIAAIDTQSFAEYIRRNPAAIIEAVNRNVRGRGILRGTIKGAM